MAATMSRMSCFTVNKFMSAVNGGGGEGTGPGGGRAATGCNPMMSPKKSSKAPKVPAVEIVQEVAARKEQDNNTEVNNCAAAQSSSNPRRPFLPRDKEETVV